MKIFKVEVVKYCTASHYATVNIEAESKDAAEEEARGMDNDGDLDDLYEEGDHIPQKNGCEATAEEVKP